MLVDRLLTINEFFESLKPATFIPGVRRIENNRRTSHPRFTIISIREKCRCRGTLVVRIGMQGHRHMQQNEFSGDHVPNV